MIATLRGELIFRQKDRIVVDVRGVGYEVLCTEAVLYALPEIGAEVFLYIQSEVREDSITFYGFLDGDEKRLFLKLKSVSGIGPKLALAILSGVRPAELVRAIMAEDVTYLKRLPGIGKKTAERLCLELKDKVEFIPEAMSGAGGVSLAPVREEGIAADVVSALVNLGYPRASARMAVEAVRRLMNEDEFAALSLETLLRQSLRSLA